MEVGLLGRKEPKLPPHTPPTQSVWCWAFMEGLTWKIMIIFEDMLACVQKNFMLPSQLTKKTSHSTNNGKFKLAYLVRKIPSTFLGKQTVDSKCYQP